MRIFKFVLCFGITLTLIYFLDNSWTIKGITTPPIGKFFDPYRGFWQNSESTDTRPAETVSIPGLKGEVTVVYDSILIPHVFAQSDEDLYFTQGYITASHRLWQMEFQTHFAAGRLSEILGDIPAVLDIDRRQRRLGMVYGAEKALEDIMNDPELRVAADAYTAGVNAYISSLSYKDLPFEYKLMGYAPEPWTNLKFGLVYMTMSNTLNLSEQDLEFTNALKLFGKEMVDFLYADSDRPTGNPIVDNPGGWKFTPVNLDTVPLALPDELIEIQTPKGRPKGVGSNNWAVHGSKTATGAPILCNDPHLTLSFPSIWYAIHLNSPGVNSIGASLPGAPIVFIGYNDSIAWGVTNAQRDLVDWYKIQFKDEKRDHYLSDGKWVPSKKRIEEIRVKGKESYYDTVVYTHHGPVMYDKSFHGENEKNHYAFRWIAHDGVSLLKNFYALNRAKNYNEYVESFRVMGGPAQNFAFASTQGDIAIRVHGKFPVRRKGEGKFILDGTKTSTEWKAFIPFEQAITIRNPERGFISSANQYPADETYPYYIQSDWYETFRNRRINEVLSTSQNITPQDMMKLQHDNYNLQAAESLPLMLKMLDTLNLKGEEKRVYEALGYWDFFNGPESVEASYYDAWWEALELILWDEILSQKVTLEMPDDYVTIQVLKSRPDISFVDNQSTTTKEDLSSLVRTSFKTSLKTIEDWEKANDKTATWADYKDTYIEHLSRREQLSQHVRLGGDRGIVNAAGHRAGPSWRMVVSLEKNNVKGWGVYPAGQSGNPGSPFYDNLVNAWAIGKYYQLNLVNKPQALEKVKYATTKLIPETE
jgi:penicillin G amidase